jgi:glutamine amidotransferase
MKRDAVIIGCCGANLASLVFALERLGVEAPITADPARVEQATHVLLPGVGAARSAMERLDAAGLTPVLPRLTQPVLGICLGMQLLFSSSEEEDVECLGMIRGRAARLPQSAELPVPHMGWNQLELAGESPLLQGIAEGGYAYFVHSYAVPVGSYTRAASRYGVEFTAVVEQRNFYGTQFHPERSSQVGARILENFFSL